MTLIAGDEDPSRLSPQHPLSTRPRRPRAGAAGPRPTRSRADAGQRRAVVGFQDRVGGVRVNRGQAFAAAFGKSRRHSNPAVAACPQPGPAPGRSPGRVKVMTKIMTKVMTSGLS
jgi:hypothetical protein